MIKAEQSQPSQGQALTQELEEIQLPNGIQIVIHDPEDVQREETDSEPEDEGCTNPHYSQCSYKNPFLWILLATQIILFSKVFHDLQQTSRGAWGSQRNCNLKIAAINEKLAALRREKGDKAADRLQSRLPDCGPGMVAQIQKGLEANPDVLGKIQEGLEKHPEVIEKFQKDLEAHPEVVEKLQKGLESQLGKFIRTIPSRRKGGKPRPLEQHSLAEPYQPVKSGKPAGKPVGQRVKSGKPGKPGPPVKSGKPRPLVKRLSEPNLPEPPQGCLRGTGPGTGLPCQPVNAK